MTMKIYDLQKERFNTTTLEIKIQPGLILKFQAQGCLSKKSRRTALLLLLKAIKKEIQFMTTAHLYHEDSGLLRRFYDQHLIEASTYQATAVETPEQKFGHRIRVLRNGLGMTQQELALLSGMRRDYISRIERGHHELNLPARKRLEDLLSTYYAMMPNQRQSSYESSLQNLTSVRSTLDPEQLH